MRAKLLNLHFHHWVWDSQGTIYCAKCRKFKGWKDGKIEIKDGVHVGWGYLLNGNEWRKQKEQEIAQNGGRYL